MYKSFEHRFMTTIHDRLRGLPGEPSVLISRHQCEAANWLVIHADFHGNPSNAAAIEAAHGYLGQAVQELTNDHLYMALRAFVNYLALVPTWCGKLLFKHTYVLDMGALDQSETLLQAKFYQFPDLPESLWKALGFERWDRSFLVNAFLAAGRRLAQAYLYAENFRELDNRPLWEGRDEFLKKVCENIESVERQFQFAKQALLQFEGIDLLQEVVEQLALLDILLEDPEHEAVRELLTEVPIWMIMMGLMKNVGLVALDHTMPQMIVGSSCDQAN